MKPDVSIIIVEYRDTRVLGKALRSCSQHGAGLRLEIIVVSNSAYSPKLQADLAAGFPEVRFLFNRANLGFARAVNQGIALSSGEYVLLLNPDAALLDDGLQRTVAFLRQRPQIGVLGPRVVDLAGQVQDSCRQFLTPSRLLVRIWRRLRGRGSRPVLEELDYHAAQPVDWLSGACLLARRAAIQDAGLMDERYFLYIEDMDWCRSFREHGWQVYYWPAWQVEHNAARSSTAQFWLTNRKTWMHLLNLGKYYLKWGFSPKPNSKKRDRAFWTRPCPGFFRK